ncbi:MAG: HEAT repeat domain-containing protein [Planctomycetes bacterium]|nr:HEAT repeat domain-containing protein [Planctomycetota bacterium]
MKRIAIVMCVALAAAFLTAGCGSVDPTVTQKPGQTDLNAEQIKAKLSSDKFSDKLEARKQLGKLPPAEQVSILTGLLADKRAGVRLVAVQELKKLSDPAAKAALAKVAAGDPDPEVKAAAK